MTAPVLFAARQVSFGYVRDTPILSNWSAEFVAGEVVAITAPSGRGKSTLLYVLGLMLRPASGQVLIDGHDAANLGDAKRARFRAHQFGFVFQDAALDSTRTVMDNIIETALYRGDPREAARERARQLMDHFGVALQAGAKPGQVSGGQAQRIALCRALLNDPRILLADEPTGNLDPISSELVVGSLHAQADKGAAVIVVTHDPLLVSRCDRVIRL